MNSVDSTYRKTILSKQPQLETVATSPVSIKKINNSSTIESEIKACILTYPILFNKVDGSALTMSDPLL